MIHNPAGAHLHHCLGREIENLWGLCRVDLQHQRQHIEAARWILEARPLGEPATKHICEMAKKQRFQGLCAYGGWRQVASKPLGFKKIQPNVQNMQLHPQEGTQELASLLPRGRRREQGGKRWLHSYMRAAVDLIVHVSPYDCNYKRLLLPAGVLELKHTYITC